MECTVETQFNKELIKQGTILMDDGKIISTMASNIIRLEEQGVRDALIKLGWTPPKDEGSNMNNFSEEKNERDEFISYFISKYKGCADYGRSKEQVAGNLFDKGARLKKSI